MRVDINRKENHVSIVPETYEDLWYIYKLITPGSVVKAHSTRKFKPQGSSREERVNVSVTLNVEKTELHKHANILRVMGKIVEIKPEEIAPIGAYHTIDVEIGGQIKIIKEWKPFEFDLLKEGVEASKRPIITIVMVDYDKALFASLKQYGVEFGIEIENNAAKKDKDIESGKFFHEITEELERCQGTVIIAGPGFAKENLYNMIKNEKPALAKRVKIASASNNERSGVYEVLKSEEVHNIIEDEHMHAVFVLLERFLKSVGKGDGLSAYGKEELERAAEASAIDILIVVDSLVRSDAFYEKILDSVKKKGGEVHIIPEESQIAEQVKAFGGAIALLRYRMR